MEFVVPTVYWTSLTLPMSDIIRNLINDAINDQRLKYIVAFKTDSCDWSISGTLIDSPSRVEAWVLKESLPPGKWPVPSQVYSRFSSWCVRVPILRWIRAWDGFQAIFQAWESKWQEPVTFPSFLYINTTHEPLNMVTRGTLGLPPLWTTVTIN